MDGYGRAGPRAQERGHQGRGFFWHPDERRFGMYPSHSYDMRNDFDPRFFQGPNPDGWQPHYDPRNPAHFPQAQWNEYLVPYPRYPAAVNGVAGHTIQARSHPPTNLERYRLFETLLGCRMDEPNFNQKTYLALYWLEFTDLTNPLTSPLFENNACGHAEDYLLDHLRLQLRVVQQERLKSIIIMQNASPCSGCSKNFLKDLGDVLEKNNGVEITLVFSAFHWLRRLSCRHEGHNHKAIPIGKHKDNREGLRNLRDRGVTVRTTCYEDWRNLCKALQVPTPVWLASEETYHRSERGQDDDRLRGDLQEILA